VPASLLRQRDLVDDLVGVAPFTSQGCTAVFTDSGADILGPDGTLVLHATKAPGSLQWIVDLDKPVSVPEPVASANLAKRFESVQQRVRYTDALFGNPAGSTMQRALDKGWVSAEQGWNICTPEQYRTHHSDGLEAAISHMVELRQGLDSTKRQPSVVPAPQAPADAPDTPLGSWAALFNVPVAPDGVMHADFKGPHPTKSRQGNTHILVMLHQNYAHLEPCAGQSDASVADAFKRGYDFYAAAGVHDLDLRIDNIQSPHMLSMLARRSTAQGRPIRVTYVPPGLHRANKAERAIQTMEATFLGVTASLDPNFPANEWDRLLPQIELMQAHLVPWGLDASISAWHGLHGRKYDFRSHPCLPAGVKVAKQIDAVDRGSFGDKAKPAFALGPALQHYRAFRVLAHNRAGVPQEFIEAQIKPILHSGLQMPRLTPDQELSWAVQDLTAALKQFAKQPQRDDFALPHMSLLQQARAAMDDVLHHVDAVPPAADAPAAQPAALAIGPPAAAAPAPASPTIAPPLPAAAPARPSAASAPASPTIAPPLSAAAPARPPPYRPPPLRMPVGTARPPPVAAPVPVSNRFSALLGPDGDAVATPPPAAAVTRTRPRHHLVSPHMLAYAGAFAARALDAAQPDKATAPGPPSAGRQRVPTGAARPTRQRVPSQPTVPAPPPARPPPPPRPSTFAGLSMAKGCASTQRAPRMPPPHTDPAVLDANPPFLAKVLAGEPLSYLERTAWKAWINTHILERTDAATADAARILNLNDDGSPLTFNSALNGPEGDIWHANNSAELDRFFATGSWKPTLPSAMPPGVHATYYGPKVKEKLKTDRATGEQYVEHRVRGTIGGDRLQPFGPTSVNTAETEVLKCFLNSVVSERAIFFTADIKDFYLGTDLPPEESVFVWVPVKHFTEEQLDRHQLRPFIRGDQILFQCLKTIFGLKNAGRLSKEKLDRILAARDYYEDDLVPCIYRHTTNGVKFVLVVDDFAVSARDEAGKAHFLATLRDAGYVLDVDHAGSKFVGLTINYQRAEGVLEVSMPGYVDKLMARFAHRNIRPADSPVLYEPPQYGAKAQLVKPPDSSDPLTAAEYRELQEIIGGALWYARMVDLPTLPAVSMLATDLSANRASLNARADRLLGHLRKYPNNKIRYQASDMVYHAYSDVSYLSVSKSRSRAGGIGFFGWRDDPQRLNGAVSVLCKVLDVIVSSACEGEYGAAYLVARNAVWIRAIATALGYPQPPTTIMVDNTCAIGLANDTLKTAKTKAIDVRFHWLRDRVRQDQFHIVWVPSGANLADFFTKALPVHEHIARQRQVVHTDGD
jgi:hypothetical protein